MKRPCLNASRGCTNVTTASRCHPCQQRHGTGHSFARLSAAVIERDGRRCRLGLPGCTGVATTADHIDPHGAGVAGNLQAACRSCNAAKG
ncbi:MAG: HNH endonuclease [Actinomycetota bacterium]|nr:HNH endonuclease [Actinomycetota bacterium]